MAKEKVGALTWCPGLRVDRIRILERHILEEPARFFMDGFQLRADPDGRWPKHFRYRIPKRVPACRTAACIAGWAFYLFGKDFRSLRECLGLPEGFLELACAHLWPEPFRSREMKLQPGTKKYAQNAVDRMEYLILEGR